MHMVFKKENRQEKVAAHWEKVNLKHKDKYGIYEDGEFVGAIGQNGRLLLLPDRVRIICKGLMSLATQGMHDTVVHIMDARRFHR
jgi:hypothetical protein